MGHDVDRVTLLIQRRKTCSKFRDVNVIATILTVLKKPAVLPTNRVLSRYGLPKVCSETNPGKIKQFFDVLWQNCAKKRIKSKDGIEKTGIAPIGLSHKKRNTENLSVPGNFKRESYMVLFTNRR